MCHNVCGRYSTRRWEWICCGKSGLHSHVQIIPQMDTTFEMLISIWGYMSMVTGEATMVTVIVGNKGHSMLI